MQSIPKQCVFGFHSYDRAVKTPWLCAVYSLIEILIIFSVPCPRLNMIQVVT